MVVTYEINVAYKIMVLPFILISKYLKGFVTGLGRLIDKGAFTNYVDKILAFLTTYPPTLTFSNL